MNNHVTDEERLERIKRVVELVGSGMSYRECAEYLSANEFKISYVTVKDYIQRATRYKFDGYQKCLEVIKTNTPKTIKDEEVIKRIKHVYELLKLGYTIEEIAKASDSTTMIVYHDFIRLQSLPQEQLDELNITQQDIEEIKNSMTEKSLNNLKNLKSM